MIESRHQISSCPLDILTTPNDGFTGLSATPDSIMVDPRLAMLCPRNLSGSKLPLSMFPSIWDIQLGSSMPLSGQPSDWKSYKKPRTTPTQRPTPMTSKRSHRLSPMA